MTDTMTAWVNPDLAKTPEELLVERSARIKAAYITIASFSCPTESNIECSPQPVIMR